MDHSDSTLHIQVTYLFKSSFVLSINSSRNKSSDALINVGRDLFYVHYQYLLGILIWGAVFEEAVANGRYELAVIEKNLAVHAVGFGEGGVC